MRDRFKTGMRYEGRLDSVFLVPTPEAATQRLLKVMQDNLKRRYENEKMFSLDDDSLIVEDGTEE